MPSKDVSISTAKTTFEIIDELRRLDGAGVSELADSLDKPTSTIHDYLRTLEHEEYLINNDGTYKIGARFLELGEQVQTRMKVFNVAQPEVDSLAEKTGEHEKLIIEEHGRGVFLYRAQGSKAVQLDTHAGMRVLLQITSLGKTIMANRLREKVEAVFDRHGLPKVTENTIVDPDELFEKLAEVREGSVQIR